MQEEALHLPATGALPFGLLSTIGTVPGTQQVLNIY